MMDGSLLLLGLSGPELTPAEAALFRKLQPAGYILSARNIVTPHQTRKLTDDLRDLSNELPVIAIDQQGGRCQPHHGKSPPQPRPHRRSRRARTWEKSPMPVPSPATCCGC